MSFRKAFFVAVAFMVTFGASVAMAAEGGDFYPLAPLGAGLAIGLAALGGAFGQARMGAAALEGIARNPSAYGKIFIPMIIGLALIESLVIYALIVALVKIKI